MYTFNYFCFGHKLSIDKELNNELHDNDFSFSRKINNRIYEIHFPYHGGQVSGDCYSCVFGTIITDDDGNPDYIDEVRNAQESDYIDDYNTFIMEMTIEFESDSYSEFEMHILKIFSKLKKFLSENNPEFYSVQASS